jgi:putative oxidoreductase
MTLERTSAWLHSHRGWFIDFVRIYLGLGLLIKGVFFLVHPESLARVAGSLPPSIVGLVPYAHIIGGLLLAAGIATRVAAIIQIPIVAGALLAVHLPNMTSVQTHEAFEFSSLTLFLLILIAIWGGGPLSLDRRIIARHKTVQNENWLRTRSDLFMDMIRAYLGIGLFVKGIYILQNQAMFQQFIENTGNMPLSLMAAAHYVIPVHLVGGVMLLLGLATRYAAVAQIPLLIGAIFYVYLPRFATLELRQNLEFTGLVLFLLSLLSVYGSGRYSLDYILHRSEEREHLRELEQSLQRPSQIAGTDVRHLPRKAEPPTMIMEKAQS